MNGDITQWNSGLLFAALCVLLGTSGLVAARRTDDRWMASGLLMQGILLTFVVGADYFHGSSDLHLGGLVILGLLIIQTLHRTDVAADEGPHKEDETA